MTAPLFTESATEREMHAVDSENSKNLTDDGRRSVAKARTSLLVSSTYRGAAAGYLVWQTAADPEVGR